MIHTDTSFLFSLYGNDAHTATAQAWVRTAKQPIAVTVLNRYEFANAIRFAAFRHVISVVDGQASLTAFETDVTQGFLHPLACDLAAVVHHAERLSRLHTASGGHRSFDILHVAAAQLASAATFLTFDANQRRLAATAGLATGP